MRWITIREPYWTEVTELTNSNYERFDPGHERSWRSPDDDSPVVNVSFEDANAWGLHDLHGNVWEWCEETYLGPLDP